MIGPRLLITNHHVVNARAPTEPAASASDFELQGKKTEADFDYLEQGATPTTVPSIECVAEDSELDYALLRLEAAADDRAPLRLRINPLTRPQTSALQERVNVLQHPNGDRCASASATTSS